MQILVIFGFGFQESGLSGFTGLNYVTKNRIFNPIFEFSKSAVNEIEERYIISHVIWRKSLKYLSIDIPIYPKLKIYIEILEKS